MKRPLEKFLSLGLLLTLFSLHILAEGTENVKLDQVIVAKREADELLEIQLVHDLEVNDKNSSPTRTTSSKRPDVQSTGGKHVPVAGVGPSGCCGCERDPGVQQPSCTLPSIYLDAKSPQDEKHVPIAMDRPSCCGCDGGDLGVMQPSCSLPSVETDVLPGPTLTSHHPGQRKIGCETRTGNPRTVTVSAVTTTYTTRVTTLRRISRLTSFSTTTGTSTIRLTKTVLSISARTLTTEIFFTMPTFLLLTKYYYIDTTSTTVLVGPTFVATFPEIETIVANSLIRTTTTTTSTEFTFKTLTTDTQTVFAVLFVTFTDATNLIITNAPSSRTFTIQLDVNYLAVQYTTETFEGTITIVVVPNSSTTSSQYVTLYGLTQTISVFDSVAAFATSATTTFTQLIN